MANTILGKNHNWVNSEFSADYEIYENSPYMILKIFCRIGNLEIVGKISKIVFRVDFHLKWQIKAKKSKMEYSRNPP